MSLASHCQRTTCARTGATTRRTSHRSLEGHQHRIKSTNQKTACQLKIHLSAATQITPFLPRESSLNKDNFRFAGNPPGTQKPKCLQGSMSDSAICRQLRKLPVLSRSADYAGIAACSGTTAGYPQIPPTNPHTHGPKTRCDPVIRPAS
jgi:hypothetical protein